MLLPLRSPSRLLSSAGKGSWGPVGLTRARGLPCHFCLLGSAGWCPAVGSELIPQLLGSGKGLWDLIALAPSVPAPLQGSSQAFPVPWARAAGTGLFPSRWLLARRSHWQSLSQMCTAVHTPRSPPDASPAVCQAGLGAGIASRECQASLSGPRGTSGRVAELSGQSCRRPGVPAKAPHPRSPPRPHPDEFQVRRVGLAVFPLAEAPPA